PVLCSEREARTDVALSIGEKRRERPMIRFEQSLKQLLTIRRPREVEISSLEFRIEGQHQRFVAAKLDIQIEPFSISVFAAGNDHSIRVLRMGHVAQPHLVEISAKSLDSHRLLLSGTRDTNKKHRTDDQRDYETLRHRVFQPIIATLPVATGTNLGEHGEEMKNRIGSCSFPVLPVIPVVSSSSSLCSP